VGRKNRGTTNEQGNKTGKNREPKINSEKTGKEK